tara:strand:- start:434 stop:682 length:249 start_codon:yes stop_codon:yes gene_type:complete
MKVKIEIFPKKEVLDPETKIVMKSLNDLGFNKLKDIKLGKQILLNIEGQDKNKVFDYAKEICEKLLVNTVIQDYKIYIDEDK